MTKTEQTFSMWYGDVIAKWYKQDNLRLGQLFTDELYTAGKAGIANALVYMACDPFYHNTIEADCLSFVERMWDSPLAKG